MNKKNKRILIFGISISAMICIICITLHIVFSPNNVEEVLWDLFDGKEYENTDFEMSELIYHEDMQKPDIISVIYNGHIYGNINRGSIIDEKYVDLSEAIYVVDNKEEPLEAYKIQGISDDYKIAVKIDDIYWGYRTSDYVQPKTLKEYLNDYDGNKGKKTIHHK